MFPDITGEEWNIFGSKRRFGIGSREDIERAIRFFYEPNPAGSKSFQRNIGELFLKYLEIVPPVVESCSEVGTAVGRRFKSRRFTMNIFVSSHHCRYAIEGFKIECMIPDLCGIIKNRAGRSFADDFFELGGSF